MASSIFQINDQNVSLAETADIHNNPLDNLSDLREIHQFHIDLSNYTDHLAVESSAVQPEPAVINDHFDILPDVDTRDFNHTGFYSGEEEALDSEAAELNPALYEVVTSTAEENEQKTYDETLVDTEHFDGASRQEGMDGKYYTLLENIHRKIHERMNQTEGEGEEEAEVHHEDNDVLHPLISLTAIKPNSMRLAITPKTYSKDAMVKYYLCILFRAANDPSVFTVTEKAPTTHTRDGTGGLTNLPIP